MSVEPLLSKWEVKRLEELSSAIQYGYTAKATSERIGPKLLRITDIQNDAVDWDAVPFCEISEKETEKYRLGKNDLLFARTGATVGKSYLIPGSIPESVFASYLIRVRLLETVYPKYVAYFFRSGDYWRQITENQVGIGQPNVNGTKLAQIKIPVAPLNQQGLIVAEIEKQFSRLDEAVANLKRVKANLKRYKAAVLKAAVEGKLTEDWRKQHPNVEPANKLLERILAEHRAKWSGRGKYKEPAKSDKSNLPSLPKGWAWCAVNQISRKITDGEHLSPICQPAGIPLLSAKDVRESGVLLDEVKYVSPEDAKRFRMRCDPDRDDILIVSRGATIGRSCAVKTEKMFCLMGSVILIKVCGEISASYILTALKSVSTVKRLVGASGSTAQQAIYIQDIRSLPIPLPPQDEQEQIIA